MHATHEGIFPALLDLADDVERAVIEHLHAHPGILEIPLGKPGTHRRLEAPQGLPTRADLAHQGDRYGAGVVHLELAREVFFAKDNDSELIARAQLVGGGLGFGSRRGSIGRSARTHFALRWVARLLRNDGARTAR